MQVSRHHSALLMTKRLKVKDLEFSICLGGVGGTGWVG